MKNNMKSITVGDKGWNDELPLSEKLKLSESEREEFDPIPPYLLRKYIIYAKEYVFPILSEEAKAVLKDFYLELRKNYQTAEATPITTRQLESMVRLAEAKAKSELREIVTEQDAKDVVEIMKESLCEIFSDERGNLDFSRSKGMSKSKQTKSFIKFLDTESKNSGRSIFTMQELYNFASQINFKVDNFREFVEILNHQGVLLKKPNNRYQLITGI
jgi:DNA helicase MCM8